MAELNISERQVGDVTVLDMDGKITIGEGSVALRTAIRRLLEEGKKKILLNLAKVGYIDSSGIGELVSSYTAINKEGGELKLLNLTQKLQDLLTITKLLTVFDVYESEEEASPASSKAVSNLRVPQTLSLSSGMITNRTSDKIKNLSGHSREIKDGRTRTQRASGRRRNDSGYEWFGKNG